MITAVDTNVLLALLYEDEHANKSEVELRRVYREGRVVITPLVYAELTADGHFDTTSELDQFLEDFSIQLVEPSREALFRAGEQFQQYTVRRPDGLQCPSCGTKQTVRCEECSEDLAPRQHIASDFVIGGHATVDGDALVSFDNAFYETYFPALTVYPK
ncbi:type II toxin-antitoxin system VapC family toxin [Natrialba asiatica]|uniref:Nucleic acid-binding protein n=1 Tax=Natrialba asiatica (strain ATCC 700177 / DSM 12278 / JCM 9576 / FERM P-10747 / NBRC 102637 / 172P1) TaxID=29540 RepID=M0AFE9_NATA1|nr:type II toxin-antitoxin system VapC family toxin [Natrialba asiatica]ELY97126.1 nucleic acid-binding protein [Natrialba asiatica DSM 12278]